MNPMKRLSKKFATGLKIAESLFETYNLLNDLFSIAKISLKNGLRRLLESVDTVLRNLKLSVEEMENWSTILSYTVNKLVDDRTKVTGKIL